MPPLSSLGFLSTDAIDYFAKQEIVTVEDFAMEDHEALPGLDDPRIRKAVDDLLGYLGQCHSSWQSGLDLLHHMDQLQYLSTGIWSLDFVLQGGLREGTITELVGPSSSGKTQVCMYAAASVAYKHGYGVAYVDTSNSFSPKRLYQIANLMAGCSPWENQDEQLDGIKRAMMRISSYSVYDVHALLDALHEIRACLVNPDRPLRLVVADCPASVISPVLGGNNVQGHALMVSVGQVLKSIALDTGVAVLITNNTVASGSQRCKPALGESWTTVPHICVMLDKQQETSSCTATLVKHTSQPCGTQVGFSFDGV